MVLVGAVVRRVGATGGGRCVVGCGGVPGGGRRVVRCGECRAEVGAWFGVVSAGRRSAWFGVAERRAEGGAVEDKG